MKADVRTVVIAFYAVNATCSPFFSLILQDHEFSITAIGHIISFSKMTTLFGTPALCSIADTMHCHTPLLLLIGFAMTTLMLLWYVLPYASETPTWSFWLTVMVLGAYNALKGSAAVIVDTIILKALDRQEEVAIVSPTTETEPLLEGSESAQEVPSSTSSSSAAYPLLRLWGSISYGCVALTTGLIVRAYISLSRPPPQPNEGSRGDTTVHKDSDDWAVTNPPSTTGVATTSRPYRIVILIHVMCLVFFCWNVYFILYRRLHLRDASPIRPTRTTSNKSEEFINGGLHASSSSLEPGVNSPAHVGNGESSTLTNNKKSAVDRRVSSPLLDMTAIQQAHINQLYTGRAFTLRIYKRVLTDPRIFVVLTGVMALGMCETAFTIFLFPYARRQLGAPPQLMSCIMFIHMLSEIVAYRKCSELLLHCPKEYLFLTASLGYATKMYVYSTIENPWWLLLVESLHGLCSSVNWATAVAHVNANVQHISRGFELEQQRLLDEMNALYDEGMWKHSHVRGVDAVEDSSVHEFSQAPIYAQEPRLHCPPLDLMSTTLSVLWFASIGIPGMTAGLVPTIITTLCGPSTTPIEVRLFGAMCVMCVLTGGFFLWCGRLGLLR